MPPADIRALRDLTRYRRTLVEERTRAIQRLEKVMQDAGIKLTSVASTLLGKSGRAIIDALLSGATQRADAAALAADADARGWGAEATRHRRLVERLDQLTNRTDTP